jgi:hypothetical protein
MDNSRLHLFHQNDQKPLVTVPSNTPMAEVIHLMSQPILDFRFAILD